MKIVLQNINETLKMYYIPRFKCEIFQAKVKDVIIDSSSSIVNEENLEATSNGLSLQAMDSVHISLVWLNMKEEGLEEYRCDKNARVGFGFTWFWKSIKINKAKWCNDNMS